MIVHVLGRAGGHDVQHLVVRIVGIDNHLRAAVAAVRAERSPGGRISADRVRFERAVLDELHGCNAGPLDDADVVDQQFALVEQPEDKFAKAAGVVAGAVRGDAAIGVRPPLGSPGFIAGRPGLGHRVVGRRIAQFEARSAAVGIRAPTSAVVIMHLVGRVTAGVFQHDPFPAIGERAGKIADDLDVGILRGEFHGIASDDQILARRDRRSQRKIEPDPVVESPTRQVDRVATPVEQFDPLLIRLAERPGLLNHFGRQKLRAEGHVAEAAGRLMHFDGQHIAAPQQTRGGNRHEITDVRLAGPRRQREGAMRNLADRHVLSPNLHAVEVIHRAVVDKRCQRQLGRLRIAVEVEFVAEVIRRRPDFELGLLRSRLRGRADDLHAEGARARPVGPGETQRVDPRYEAIVDNERLPPGAKADLRDAG